MLVLVCVTLVPAVARMKRDPADAKCQSNMRRWAQAMALYIADNDGRYPTNRTMTGTMTYQVVLTPLDSPDYNYREVRFLYGVNWVEALYDYVWDAADRTDQDWTCFMRCPNAKDITWPSAPVMEPYALMTYAMNYNLVEYWHPLVRNPQKVMMLREMDRRVVAHCRPINRTTGDGTANGVPRSPFLTRSDYVMSSAEIDPNLHGGGSHIVFADGHVRHFTTDFFPGTYDMPCTWDSETQQWYNYVWDEPSVYNKSIAITP